MPLRERHRPDQAQQESQTRQVREDAVSAEQDLAVPGEAGNVAGWGVTVAAKHKTEDVLKKVSQFLQESAFTVQEDSLCRNKTQYYFDSNTTFCAGDGKGGNDTCMGDNGGPFVREGLMNAQEKDYRWMAAGIVSWGEGCAQKDKYGYYTRVWPFVDWIEKTIKDNSDPADEEDDVEWTTSHTMKVSRFSVFFFCLDAIRERQCWYCLV